MKQLWLVLAFLVVMVLIGRGWQRGPATAGLAVGSTPVPTSAAGSLP